MASTNDECLLSGMDLGDSQQIRRIMIGLQYHLTHSILSLSSEDLSGLTPDETALISAIMAAIRNNGSRYPLLLEAALRFVASRCRDDLGVLSAAHEFKTLSSAQVLIAPNLYPEAYEKAEARMRELRGTVDVLRIRQRLSGLAPGAFGRQIYHTTRSDEIEVLARNGSGDVRDIPYDIQFGPHPVPDGPQALSFSPCEQCFSEKKEPAESARVTRSLAKMRQPTTGESHRDPIVSGPPSSNREDEHPCTTEVPQTGGRKRKQQTTYAKDEPVLSQAKNKAELNLTTNPESAKATDTTNEQVMSRPSKRAKINLTNKLQSAKLEKVENNDATDNPVVSRSTRKAKLNLITKSESARMEEVKSGPTGSSASTKSDGETGKRVLRGRPELDHDGKKCCNTCQAWKDLAQFGLKKHSKTPGEKVGYCLRCQASKRVKNKAKAKFKKEKALRSKIAALADIDVDTKDESDDENVDDDKSPEGLAVNAEE